MGQTKKEQRLKQTMDLAEQMKNQLQQTALEYATAEFKRYVAALRPDNPERKIHDLLIQNAAMKNLLEGYIHDASVGDGTTWSDGQIKLIEETLNPLIVVERFYQVEENNNIKKPEHDDTSTEKEGA